jgi:signal transduction histidine kinase
MPAQPKNLYYDREHSLPELLREIDRPQLEMVLQGLLGIGARLLDLDETVLAGPAQAPDAAARAPVRLDFEPLGYVEGTRTAGLPSAALLVEMLLVAVMRYYMVSAIHMEAVQQDYAALQEKHAALQESEARYRALAASLEQRVSEQVQTIEATQRQLYQAEKLASVGQLAAGVAHEINNPLGFIKSNLHAAGSYVASLARFGATLNRGGDAAALRVAWQLEQLDQALADFPALLGESIDGVERVARIVSALKDFSRVDHAGETTADVNALLATTCTVAANQFGARIRLVTDYGALPALRCDTGRLSQVFLNLLLNAVQAIPDQGEVRLATACDGQTITVTIADTGKGIAPEILERIFDPFYTTRDVGQGTGLGLTVARDVVQAHGGRIAVQSTPGSGTTFTIELPVARAA